ncbi:MAG: 30S ribosomal protein S8 [Lentisphaeria bacterium]
MAAIIDPIADMLTRIRNAGQAGRPTVTIPASREKAALATVLREAGYIADCRTEGDQKRSILIDLKYSGKKPVIEGLKRISSPARRVYVHSDEIPRVMGGLGISVLSTSKGLMSDRAARRQNLGGELLCEIW